MVFVLRSAKGVCKGVRNMFRKGVRKHVLKGVRIYFPKGARKGIR